jgi:hypothetical protein
MRIALSMLSWGFLSVSTVVGAVEIMVSVNPDNIEVLDWLDRGDLCERIEVQPGVTVEQLRSLRQRGWGVVVQMMGHPESFDRRFINRPGRPAPKPDKIFTQEQELDRHIAGAEGDAQKVTWEFIMEEDSAGVAFPYRMLIANPQTHEQAYALFEKRLGEALAAARSSRAKGIRLWGRAGYASSMHPFAKTGVAMNLIERTNDDIEDLSTGIAFARGAARQFGCQWGVDFSQWWGAISGLDMDFGGAYFRRNFYMSYFAGADLLAIEAIRPPRNGAEDNAPRSLGHALEEFSAFRKRVEAGATDRPVAVMLPRDHGWLTPAYWRTQNEAWNYARIGYRPGDRSIDGLFAAAFPGSTFAMQPWPFGAYEVDDPPASPFALSSVDRLYVADDAHVYRAPPPVPFGRFRDRREAKRVMNKQKTETSPYRPMADSRWGDMVDVLTDEASPTILSQYDVLIMGGPIEITGILRTNIQAFVEQGGALVWAAGMARPEHGSLTGMTMQPEFRVGRAWTDRDGNSTHEPFLYFPSTASDDARIEILAHTHNQAPLVVRNTVGRGEVYTCLSPWYASERAPLSGFALAMLDTVMAAVQPITIEGIPVQWCSTRTDHTRTVAIANHSGEPWKGAVCIRDLPPDLRVCREMRGGKSQSFTLKQGITRLDLSIPAYDVAVVRWSME